MNIPPQLKEAAVTAAGFVTGTAGVSFPIWSEAVSIATGFNTFLMSLGGVIVLYLTIRKLWRENRKTALEIALLEAKSGKGD